MHYSMNRSGQHGAALVISMIILLVVSMIVLQGARSANLELLVGNNSHAAAEALMQAEDSAAVGEMMIAIKYGGAPATDYGQYSDDGVFLEGQIDVESVDWDSMELEPERFKSSANYSAIFNGEETSTDTQYGDGSYREYYAEYLGPSSATGGSMSVGAGVASDTRYLYRVSGRGQSGRGGARVIQTIYATAE
jgi:Tfp pilus assembly protein PilX